MNKVKAKFLSIFQIDFSRTQKILNVGLHYLITLFNVTLIQIPSLFYSILSGLQSFCSDGCSLMVVSGSSEFSKEEESNSLSILCF